MEGNERQLTFRQKRAISIWVRDGCKSKAKALTEAGYGMSVIRQPHKVFDSPAVIEELEKMGISHFAKGDNRALEGTVRAVETSSVDYQRLLSLTTEQIQDLKERINALPGRPMQWGNPRAIEGEEVHVSPAYIPQGTGADIFSVGAKYEPSYPRMQSFSSM